MSTELLKYLIENASRYDPEMTTPVRAVVSHEIKRKGSLLSFIDLTGPSKTLPLVVKQRFPVNNAVSWYRIVPMFDQSRLIECMGTALQQIEKFPYDPAFEPLKVYEVNVSKHMIIMERVDGNELASYILAAHRLKTRTAPSKIIAACERSGAWLKVFHDTMPPIEFSDLPVSERLFDETNCPAQLRAAITSAYEKLDPDIRTAVLHGDFWPGNILVKPNEKMTHIDVSATNSGPIYLDIAYFLVHLRTMEPQLYSHGLWNYPAVISAFENSFLRGYFGDQPIDRAGINFYQALILLYKWAQKAHMLQFKSPLRRCAKKIQLQWRAGYYRKLIEHFLTTE